MLTSSWGALPSHGLVHSHRNCSKVVSKLAQKVGPPSEAVNRGRSNFSSHDTYEAFIDAFTGFAGAKGLSVWGMGGHLPITQTGAWIQKNGRSSPAQTDRDALLTYLAASSLSDTEI